MKITCCKDCVPPKRYPGCGIDCEEYKAQKAKLEEEKKLIKQNAQPKLSNYDFNKILYANCKSGRHVNGRRK